MRILVTGANGFAGRHLIRLLGQQSDVELFAGVHRIDEVATEFTREFNAQVYPFDLGDERSIQSLIQAVRPEQTYHLAGIAKTFGVSVQEYFRLNSLGAYFLGKSILETCGKDARLLYVSSAGVYDATHSHILTESTPVQPSSEYGASKASAEAFLWSLYAKGLDVVMVRPFNHTGPGQMRGFVCPDLVYRLKQSLARIGSGEVPQLEVGKLHSVRDFTDVRDVVAAYQLIMRDFQSGSIVNVASGKGIRVQEIIDLLVHEVAGLKDVQLISALEQSSRTDDDVVVGDSTLLQRTTGWEPRYSMKDSLLELWNESFFD
ncbi:GDP-mannose 4,6-dehydratase [Sulfoacidibacillus thermotolerans]|uniref:NAD(P)-binding domain-containing protein n=1 Tax=Sulfoacidibacillus thermotolerans TaxID=1765684 RepID=A0A2U3D659_SULT2|nr:GDP-mannose 4,6-dehydratase [Sulfoacidibacillus thermotolerans]PWI56766.1 hypothetical protein BM613_12120 [Sulfoacidibacillus thermotolerans]